MNRRDVITAGAALLAYPLMPVLRANAQEWPGVTATEIKIGNTNPYSGPASSYGVVGKLHTAFWNMVNEQGGIAGRKINFISLDDAYSPPKTVEAVRRLVEQDEVSFLYQMVGAASNSAIHKYVNDKKIPHLFLSSGAEKWGDYKNYPWTMGYAPSTRTEAQIYAKYILAQKPDSKIAMIYQNDDFGKDYLSGVKDILGDKFDEKVVVVSYELSDSTIDSQITTLRASGAEALLCAVTSKFGAQAIRKVHDLGWKPLFVMAVSSINVASVMIPAGPEKSIGMVSAHYLKDTTDPRWADDPGLAEWRAFMDKYMPGADQKDQFYPYAYGAAKTMLTVLTQCNGNFSRENIMKEATNIKDLELGVLLPGIKVNTSPTNYHPLTAMQMIQWDGKTWHPFGEVIQGKVG